MAKQKRNVKIVSISLTPEMLIKIDEVRGSIPRSPWIINHINFNNEVNSVNNGTLDTLREMFERGVLKVYADKLTPKYKEVLEGL